MCYYQSQQKSRHMSKPQNHKTNKKKLIINLVAGGLVYMPDWLSPFNGTIFQNYFNLPSGVHCFQSVTVIFLNFMNNLLQR